MCGTDWAASTSVVMPRERAAAQMAAMEHMTGDVYRVGCDIERELYAANAEIERLTNKVAQLYEGAEQAKQRIKRLEEGGDEAIYPFEYAARVRIWTKAKEVKP